MRISHLVVLKLALGWNPIDLPQVEPLASMLTDL